MSPQFGLVGLVVKDMKTSLDFYRALGLDIPAGVEKEDHVDVQVGSIRLAWDTATLIQSIDASWTPHAGGHSIALAFAPAPPKSTRPTSV